MSRAGKEKPAQVRAGGFAFAKWARWDLNPQPTDYESAALTLSYRPAWEQHPGR